MRPKVALLALCMLLTGTLNTIVVKLQDNTGFRHPAFQTAAMFLGEALCLLPFVVRRWWKRRWAPPLSAEEEAARDHRLRRSFWVFGLPALCDAAASTMLNLGLFFTFASVYQMLRGTLVIFAGLLTIVLLRRRLHSHHWLGMVLICAGAALVGASSIIYDRAPGPHRAAQEAPPLTRALLWMGGEAAGGGSGGPDTAPNPLLGNVLVVAAQLFTACQFVTEEKYLAKLRAPVLLAVGLEGFWGLTLCCGALPALHYVRGADGRPLDSFIDAVREVRGSWTLQWTTAATVVSIAFFNFFGVSVTKNLSGAARATIDACRTLFIWLFALSRGWERFHLMQVVGFVVLLSGTSVYNEILRSCLPAPTEPRFRSRRHSRPATADADAGSLQEPLLLGEADFAAAQATGSQHQQEQQAKRGSNVRFADMPPPSQPIAAGRQSGADHTRYTMARSVTILPAALSPHSLASVPSASFGGASFTFSVPRNLSRGSGMDTSALGTDLEGALGQSAYDESEASVSESDVDDSGSRDTSQHGSGTRRR